MKIFGTLTFKSLDRQIFMFCWPCISVYS